MHCCNQSAPFPVLAFDVSDCHPAIGLIDFDRLPSKLTRNGYVYRRHGAVLWRADHFIAVLHEDNDDNCYVFDDMRAPTWQLTAILRLNDQGYRAGLLFYCCP